MFGIKGKPEQVRVLVLIIGFLCFLAFALGVRMGWTMMMDYLEIQDRKAAVSQGAPKR